MVANKRMGAAFNDLPFSLSLSSPWLHACLYMRQRMLAPASGCLSLCAATLSLTERRKTTILSLSLSLRCATPARGT